MCVLVRVCGGLNVWALVVRVCVVQVRDQADVMPRRQLERQLTAELGEGWERRLQSFDWTPVVRWRVAVVRVHAEARWRCAVVLCCCARGARLCGGGC